jgi:hypothetical protein
MSSAGEGSITDARVRGQIAVLNEDFRALAGTNGGAGNDARIEFFLATEDPSGNATTGITRTVDDAWFNDSGNYSASLAWDTSRYLNIYTNTASGVLGYVPSLPQGGIVGSSSDRVVVLHSAFGRNAPIGPPFDLGRTATHEVGHYLGLYHTFDFGCGTSSCYATGDRICDTNPEASPVFGCPAASVSCGTSDPFHNYMDYSDDACYTEFTPEQVNRMRCTLANWRVDLPADCGMPAANATRTGGLNLNVYSATKAVLGGTATLSVVSPSAHTRATILGYAAPRNQLLASGYMRLYNPNSAFYFKFILSLPHPGLALAMADDPSLCGLTAYTQAILSGGGAGRAFTNAVDMTAGF